MKSDTVCMALLLLSAQVDYAVRNWRARAARPAHAAQPQAAFTTGGNNDTGALRRPKFEGQEQWPDRVARVRRLQRMLGESAATGLVAFHRLVPGVWAERLPDGSRDALPRVHLSAQ
ncbi:hypothetical protein [Achromobacter ruhlandii]|uniref:hypothetical protein n=1 Tax=Achromobacter ruhlandii TaxID=72557 RepID=UPI0012E97EC9|nr:hypothetical protein [Achromobacter ruhlandii]MCZ8431490.1 hypothetical protein [Achromobacter ruhlandii]MDC6092399.1 hypothetical protein [Achromobacter ruhlandii]MDC6149648.1 hypothetical protein [Achromobacter ruhlandii]MDD7983042.1 hypothetical protein [Achromobacter ruhlandii]WIW02158.1 hypothetical protein PPH40_024105 [Achromobacter ruhlandii]